MTPPYDSFNSQSKDNQNGANLKTIRFSYFRKPITNLTPLREVTLEDVYQLIISGEFEAVTEQLRSIGDTTSAKEFKAENFDYVTFHGTFYKRQDSGLQMPSNYFIIDIDNLGEKLKEVRSRIITDRILCPQLVFISPGGNGLKILIRIADEIIVYSAKTKIMDPIWQAVNSFFANEYGDLLTPNSKGEIIDGACKDLSRPCFLCQDVNAYINVNEMILGQEFIETYQPLQVKKISGKPAATLSIKRTVNPLTTLEDLEARHLLPTDNHHPQLLAFIGAAKAIGQPIKHTIAFIKDHVHISPDSGHIDFATVQELCEDVYNRYGTDSESVQYLTQISFAYKILHFKYSRQIGAFDLNGLFWDEVRNILHNAGFAKRKIGRNFVFIQKNGCIIKEVNPELMKGYMTNYVDSIEASICFSYQGKEYQIPPAAIRETFLKNSNNIFNASWLEHLKIHDEPILKDNENEMFFFFKDKIVTVSKGGIKPENWNDKSGFCIWDTQIIQRDFSYKEDCTQSHFYRFLKNVTNYDNSRLSTMVSGIGYLMHHHFRDSEGQAVIFYDESITDIKTPMGGSGKGLIINAIKQVRNVAKVDGKHLANENRFKWELVTPSTQIVWMDDVRPDFDFSILHTNLTDGWTVERKYASQFIIDPQDSPKTVICSNSIIRGDGSTNKRRQFIIELSDFYSRQIIKGDEKPIELTHGCIFFNNTAWSADEWNMFFSLMMNCAHHYLKCGLVHSPGVNVEINRFRQATSEDFAEWVKDQGFENNKQYETRNYFQSFVSFYYGATYQISQRTFTGWLSKYAVYKGWKFDRKQSNGISYFILNSI